MKNLTLVILAAGMGSRFGGLKQIEPIGPNGEFIIDYSIYDAIRAGFKKVVFIIKEENYDIFRETIGKRVEPFIEVSYAFQSLNDIPSGYKIPSERVKPLGTAHAIYSARNYIDGDFAIINSDDFYGFDAFSVLSKFANMKSDDTVEHFGMVGYKVVNTMAKTGSVKRGVCYEDNGFLTSLVESNIENISGKIIASPLSGDPSFEVSSDTLVSMNMFMFSKRILSYITDGFDKFFKDNSSKLLTCEYLIPDVVFNGIKSGFCDVSVLSTTSKWYGVTYKEDKDDVVLAINNMIKEGLYPNNLWEK